MPVTIYEYDLNGELVEEHDENGNVLVEYTRDSDGRLISEHRNGVDRFYHYDGAGNTLALTDINGDVTDTFAYNASGEVTARTGTTPTPYQYHGEQGYYRDSETGEYHVQRRDLDPSQGRWLSADPLELIDGLNRYWYARNNPIWLFDPTGKFAEESTCAPNDTREGKWKGTCAERFPPGIFIDQAKSGVGTGCTLEQFDKAVKKCFVTTEGKYEKFIECIQKACGGGKPGKEALEALLKWIASVSCCESSKNKNDPCECGIKGPDQKPPKKCKNPLEDGNGAFPKDGGLTCQECCNFHACVAGLKTLIDLAKSAGASIPIIGSKVVWGAKANKECEIECTGG